MIWALVTVGMGAGAAGVYIGLGMGAILASRRLKDAQRAAAAAERRAETFRTSSQYWCARVQEAEAQQEQQAVIIPLHGLN